MNDVRAGETIAGKYQVERLLGEGGMGYVVAARHLQLGQTVALKFIRAAAMTKDFERRFLREARNTVRLKSKHVTRVFDVGVLDRGAPYMVMEYLEGSDLSRLLHERGKLSSGEACEYVIQICEAIAEAHAQGLVHRDLKLANLFLTRGSGGEPVVKVLDFGVAKMLDLSGDEAYRTASVVTKATDLLGSPSYMAPEQIASSRNAEPASDVWALGVVLFRLVTGQAPFGGASLGDLVQSIMYGAIPNLREVRPNVPIGLDEVVARCLDRDRTKRPTAIELARLLAPYAHREAAPSIERIAILGPAIATSGLKAASRPSNRPSGLAFKPPSLAKERPSSGRVLFRTLAVVLAMVAVAFVGVKLQSRRNAARAPEMAASADAVVGSKSAPSTSASPKPHD